MKKSPSVIKLIKLDPRVKNYLDHATNGSFSLDSENLMNEIDAIHRARFVRNLSVKKMFGPIAAQAIAKAIQQNQANRSRIVEIKMMAMRPRLLIDRKYELVSEYIRYTYASEINSKYRTQAERSSIVDHILAPASELSQEFSALEEYADEVIKDIDQAAWALKHLLDATNIELRG